MRQMLQNVADVAKNHSHIRVPISVRLLDEGDIHDGPVTMHDRL